MFLSVCLCFCQHCCIGPAFVQPAAAGPRLKAHPAKHAFGGQSPRYGGHPASIMSTRRTRHPSGPGSGRRFVCHSWSALRETPKGAHHQHQRGVAEVVEREGRGSSKGVSLRGSRGGGGTQGEEPGLKDVEGGGKGHVAGAGTCAGALSRVCAVCSYARLAPVPVLPARGRSP